MNDALTKLLYQIDLNNLYAFHLVATCGSKVEASRKLGLGHQAVARRVAKLEDSLGLRLVILGDVNKPGRPSTVLTPTGKILAEALKPFFTRQLPIALKNASERSALPDLKL